MGKLKTLVRSASIGLVFALLASITATLEAKSYDSTQMNCLALVGYHEAKGESDRGMIAVMQVTMNRVKSEKFANTVCGVVYSPNQYSWSKYNPPIKEPKQYERAKRLAYEVVNGKMQKVKYDIDEVLKFIVPTDFKLENYNPHSKLENETKLFTGLK